VPQLFVSLGFTPIQTGFTPLIQSQLLMPDTSQFHATYSQITGQPTPTYSTADTSVSDVSAPQLAQVLASAPDPLLVPVTQTEPLVTTTQIPTASGSQGQPIGPLPPPQLDTETAEQTRIASLHFQLLRVRQAQQLSHSRLLRAVQMIPQISLLLRTALLWLARLLLLPPILSFWSLMPKGER
jgi:hypothetical protein